MQNTHKEIREGTDGKGNTVYMVITIHNDSGRWIFTETFSNKEQAINWLQYA